MATCIDRSSRSARWWHFGAIALPFIAVPAFAQEKSNAAQDSVAESNEILVVAERRSARLQDIPVAITSLSAGTLGDAGITSTGELSALTPGLNFTAATGSSAPFLRGVGNNNVGPGAESSVATYVDGVYYASVSTTVFSLIGVQQIDVLKGPQGTLFGRNATGGVIQVTTLDPSSAFGGNAAVSYGSYDTVSAKGYITGGFAGNLSANLAVGYDNQGDGFGTNLTTGNDVNKTKSFSLRSKILWQPDATTTMTLSGDYSYLKSSEGNAWRPPYGSIPAAGPIFTGGKQDVYSDIDEIYSSRQGGASLKIEHDLGFAQFLSLTAYRREVQDLTGDRDMGLPLATVIAQTHRVTDQYSQELQLLGPSGGRVKWVAGLYGFHLDGAFDPLALYGPALSPLTRLEYFSGQKTWAGAIFGQVTVDDVLPETDLTVGGRYSIEHHTVDIVQTGFFGPVTVPLAATDGKDTWKSPTWRFSLNHKFSPQVAGYLSYNRGFKSGTFNLLSIPASSVKPETLDAYEAGLKIDTLNRRLKINGALFYYNYSDIQVPRYALGGVSLSNAGKARMYGVDLDASFAPTASLRLTAGLSLINAKYKAFDDAVFSTPSPTGGNIITFQSAAGNRVLLTPKSTFNASFAYTLPGALNAFDVSANYYYNDGWYPDPDNRLRQPSFNQVNAQLSWTSPDERFKLTVWGKNLSNEVFAQYFSDSDATSDVYSVSPPRTYGVTLGASF